jgi:hypothetical protein
LKKLFFVKDEKFWNENFKTCLTTGENGCYTF